MVSANKNTHNDFYVYVVKCADDTFYIGSTRDLKRRISQHNSSKRGAKYTSHRRPVILMYYEKHQTLSSALKREYILKQLSRKEKLALVM